MAMVIVPRAMRVKPSVYIHYTILFPILLLYLYILDLLIGKSSLATGNWISEENPVLHVTVIGQLYGSGDLDIRSKAMITFDFISILYRSLL